MHVMSSSTIYTQQGHHFTLLYSQVLDAIKTQAVLLYNRTQSSLSLLNIIPVTFHIINY
jgi:hypothetical protein